MFYIKAHVVAMILGPPLHLIHCKHMLMCIYVQSCIHTAESVTMLATCAQYIYAYARLLSFIYNALYTLRIKAVRPGMYHTNS